MGVLKGDRFKYPSQSFWVQPVLLDDGSEVLALAYEECMDEAPIKIDVDPTVVYDYQECLQRAICHHCGKALHWKLANILNNKEHFHDDRFCYAVCCLTRYSMVPEKVRIVASLDVPECTEDDKDDELKIEDEEFLRELQKMNLQTKDQIDDLLILSGVKPRPYEDDDDLK
jgi:hypothetical protein